MCIRDRHYDDFVESYGEPEDKSKKEAYIALALLCFRQRREAKSGKDFVALSKAQRDIIDQYHLRALNREEMTTIRPDVEDVYKRQTYCLYRTMKADSWIRLSQYVKGMENWQPKKKRRRSAIRSGTGNR